ncbi:MAG TPA: pyridoxal-phosphate dependent enzyme [Chthoniobacterales bacterium]|nr:pyridoxal-phosphate dependent enzyme [Chthoniobacterales bacterium]
MASIQDQAAAPRVPAILGLIGNTPLVEITRFHTGLCRLFVKLENQNPTGSIKDRMALAMVEAAERDGHLRPGGTIVEATAGNTGLGLALVAAVKGYQLILVIPDKMSQEKILHIRALGAKAVITRSDVTKGHPEYYQDLAEKIAAETPGAFFVNQFKNPANPLAHETSTGPEIWEQMDHEVDAVVVGVGSSGTLTGLSRFFAKVQPDCEIVLADPAGSVLTGYIREKHIGTAGSWLVEGIGEDFVPEIADLSRVKKAYSIPDKESFAAGREFLRKEGIFGGSSSGTLFAAALHYCREQSSPKRVVTFACDSGNKYLSKMYNDIWMAEQGFIIRKQYGDLRDLISRRYQDGSVVTVGPSDTLLTAFNRMRIADVSQVPVLENGELVGLLDESDLLVRVQDGGGSFREPVRAAMTDRLETLQPSESLDAVRKILDSGKVTIVMDGAEFVGLITRIDLLNYLRRKV